MTPPRPFDLHALYSQPAFLGACHANNYVSDDGPTSAPTLFAGADDSDHPTIPTALPGPPPMPTLAFDDEETATTSGGRNSGLRYITLTRLRQSMFPSMPPPGFPEPHAA